MESVVLRRVRHDATAALWLWLSSAVGEVLRPLGSQLEGGDRSLPIDPDARKRNCLDWKDRKTKRRRELINSSRMQ